MVRGMNRKGWLRIVEVSISILIIIAVLLVIVKPNFVQTTNDKSKIGILDIIAENDYYRGKILQYSPGIDDDIDNATINEINSFINSSGDISGYNYKFLICNLNDECNIQSNKEVMSEERIIIMNSTYTGSPKRIRLFYGF